MKNAIYAEGLVRTFGDIRAVDGITFAVEAGEVFGVMGPNGAGKTTLVRLLNGILVPTGGTARVYGRDVATEGDAVRQMTGVLTETPSHYERLTARQNLTFYATLYGVAEAEVSVRVRRMLELFSLEARADEPVGGFSKGMKQRLALARALIHDPKVLFLDEPTAGLDPEASRQVNSLIQELTGTGERTVFLCTHNLNEAETLCDRVAMLNRGRILATGSIKDLSERLWQAVPVDVEFLTPPKEEVLSAIGGIPGVSILSHDDTKVTLRVDGRDLIPKIVSAAVQNGGALVKVGPREYTLEEIYFAIQERGGAVA